MSSVRKALRELMDYFILIKSIMSKKKIKREEF